MEINSIKIRIHLPKNILRIACIITYLFCITSLPQNIEPRFEHISVKDGLPENSVKAFLQDYLGYMWFGTQNGLVKYDGYKMTIYQYNSSDNKSLSGNYVMALFEDRNRNLWVGTFNAGLNCFDRVTETFKRYTHSTENNSSISSDLIYTIYEDKKGRLWIGTDNGLDLFDHNYQTFKHFDFIDISYSNKVYKYILQKDIKSKTIESILQVGNNANITKTFRIKKKMPVLIVTSGEAGYDYGWLEDLKGNILFRYDFKNTFHAGGGFDNRIQIKLDTLNKGIYKLHFNSNYFYSYKDNYSYSSSFDYKVRVGAAPNHSELWGIQVLDATGDEKKIQELLNQINTIKVKSKIYAIIENKKSGQLFVGTTSPEIWELDTSLLVIRKTNLNLKNGTGEIGSIDAFYQSKDGKIWMATTNGLCCLNPTNDEINFYQPVKSSIGILSNHLNSLCEDKEGNIWAGTIFNGLVKFSLKENKFYRYENNPRDNKSITRNDVLTCYTDNSGIVWAGLWTGGISKWDRYKWKFQKFGLKNVNFQNLFNDHINTIYIDKFKVLWIGNYNGFYRIDRRNNKLKHYKHIPNNSRSLSSDSVNYIVADPKNPNIIWIGTMNGLNKFNSHLESFTSYLNNPLDSFSIGANYVNVLLVDRKGILWVGTRGGGLNKFDEKKNNFTRIIDDSSRGINITDNFILSIYEDHRGDILFGHNGSGINIYNSKDGSINKLYSSEIFSGVMTITENEEGNLWIGTFMNGLYLYNPQKAEVLAHYNSSNGLEDNIVLSMKSDRKKNIWFGSFIGLSCFYRELNIFKHFNENAGIVTPSSISPYPLYNGLSDEMFYCGQDGLNAFSSDDIIDDPNPPKVIICKITLFNRPKETLNYDGFISELKEITLPYNHNDLQFEYVGLHFGEPLRNQYKYILEGFDEGWIDAGNLRTATYTNLDPGEYDFRVIASNRDGVWNETGASLKVIINPPLWATTWAYIFYLILFGSLLYYIWKMQLKRVKVKHEFEMSRFEAQKLHEVDELKSRFFANISHEFRTPLTLILGPVKQIIERTKETKTKEDLNLVHRNANRLLSLVNQLLDISKIESGNMKLLTTSINIIPYLKALVLSFTSYAERKKIELKFVSHVSDLMVYLDKDKFEKIINNILSNAFKFTAGGGIIEVFLNQENKNLKITITDTGVGIPKEKLQKIFDRFYQVDGSHTREQEGTGIGLSLTKELVELHRGKIEVESEEGKGSIFTVSILLGTDHLKPEEICESEPEKIAAHQFENILAISSVNKVNSVDTDLVTETDKPLLLIVDDNYDIRNYIKDNLNSGYRIMEAVDGEDGWDKSVNNLPDLIVSDVMMPKMDGFELCKKLKTDERTSHIPVILLTAKAAKQDKIEGYELGADEYLMKPFEPDELRVRIKNLIAQRNKLHEHFKNKGIFEVDETKITSVDKKFLQKAFEVINQNISDITFGVEVLAELLNVSRSVLHRKIVSLTGESPGDLIRRIRLRKASQLIEQKFGNISEIAIEVGFSNPAQFARSFQKQFGITPSAYQQKNTNN